MEDSLKKRYAYKLVANLFGFAVSMVMAAIVPRGLGPKLYGNFSFLTNFFSQIVSIFDMGTSTAYYNKLSQRQNDFGIIKFYSAFVMIVFVLVLSFSLTSFIPGIRYKLWPEQQTLYIMMAALFALFSWLLQLTEKTVDAFGYTVEAEKKRIIQRIIGLSIIVVLYVWGKLNLFNYFIYHYFVIFFLFILFVIIIFSRSGILNSKEFIEKINFKKYIKEFFDYSHPLLAYSVAGMIVGIFDRWILQYYGGSIQQGFFGLAYNISTFCFLFSGAFTPLIMREFAISFEKKDLAKMANDFRKYIPFFYALTAYICCFIAIEADKVVYIFGGHQYKEALWVVAIMSIYPIYQTYGQLSSAVFLAMNKTGLYRNIGILSTLVSLPVTYFMIAPKANYGFDTGAIGLAIKTVFLAFIVVNIHLWYNSKFLNLPFWRYIGHQIAVLIVFAAVALGVSLTVNILLQGVVLKFLVSGIIYSAIIFVFVLKFPIFVGLKRQDIFYIFGKIKERMIMVR